MAQKRHIKILEGLATIADTYFSNVKEGLFYNPDTVDLFNRAKKEQTLEKSMFLGIEITLDLLEDEGGDLSELEKTRLQDLIIKYNLMILLHLVAHRQTLDLCCNNIFKAVIGERADYSQQEINFCIALRLHALRSALKEYDINDEQYDLQKEIDIYLPENSIKYYFFNQDTLSKSDKKVLVDARSIRRRLKRESVDKITEGFHKEELNDDLVKFMKNILGEHGSADESRSDVTKEEDTASTTGERRASSEEKRDNSDPEKIYEGDSVSSNVDNFPDEREDYNHEEGAATHDIISVSDEEETTHINDTIPEEHRTSTVKRSDVLDEEDTRSTKKAKVSILDVRVDARKLEKSEVFPEEEFTSLPSASNDDILRGIETYSSTETDKYNITTEVYELESDDEFEDAPATFSEGDTNMDNNDDNDVEIIHSAITMTLNSNDTTHESSDSYLPSEATSTIDDEENQIYEESERDDASAPATTDNADEDIETSNENRRIIAAGSQSRSTERASSNESDSESVSNTRARPGPRPGYGTTTYTNPDPLQKREPKRTKGPKKQKLRAPAVPWSQEEIQALEDGLRNSKGPLWTTIIKNSGGKLRNRTNVQCKDKARTELTKLERLGYTDRKDLGAWGYVKYPEI